MFIHTTLVQDPHNSGHELLQRSDSEMSRSPCKCIRAIENTSGRVDGMSETGLLLHLPPFTEINLYTEFMNLSKI